MQEEFTENGVRYKWYLASSEGAGFIIFKDEHTDKEIKEAKREIRNTRDAVTIRIADKHDIMDEYWSKVFLYADNILGLHWSQIDKDVPELFNAIRTGKTPEEYVNSKEKIWKRFKITN